MKQSFNHKPAPLNQGTDIQAHHKLNKDMTSLKNKDLISNNLLDQLPQLVWVKMKQNVDYYNQAMCEYIGQDLNLHEVNVWREFLHAEDFEYFIVLWQHALHNQQNFETQCRIKHITKGYRYCLISVQHFSKSLHAFEWMMTATDIHDYSFKPFKLKQTRLAQNNRFVPSLASAKPPILPTSQEKNLPPIRFDDLTGLYNRHGFNEILKKIIQDACALKQAVGFLMIDLDHFKHINDTLGHSAGDYLLQILGGRLSQCFKDNVIVARLGGDEFALIVPNLSDENTLLQIAKLARLQLDIPICYAGQYINGGMSIGGAIYPQDAQNSSNLLRCADIALNDLKVSGRGGIRLFKVAMSKTIEATTRQLSLARKMIQHDQILPFYQPKVHLQTGQVIGFEALLRWRDTDDNIQLPSHIFSAFQDYELATQIGAIMQLQVFNDMTQWSEMGLQLLPISINAAPVEFLRDNYAETLLTRLAKFNLPFSMIEIEITEQSLSERGADYVIRALNLLKTKGIGISLDDFGTGHSSLTRLRTYPVNCIKIDRTFIENIQNDASAVAIVKAISQIGASICLDVLVEGIETQAQFEAVKMCGCDMGQGFYFYQAMTMQEATQILRTPTPLPTNS